MTEPNPTRVCVPICEPNVEALETASLRVKDFADIIELRLDCLERTGDVSQRLNNLPRPLILTFRPSEQGGYRNLTREERLDFWNSQSTQPDIWWDLEADLINDLAPEWSRVIVSHHDFSGVPNNLDQIYERLAETPARIVKIAVTARDIIDCLPVFQLIDRARSPQKEIIAIAMGNPGIATRILGPSRGSFLTYAAVDDEKQTAPGQVNADKLRSLYNIDRITTETKICGLVGMPVMQSVSPHIHNAAFTAEGVNGVYLPFEVREVKEFFERMVHPTTRELNWNLRGLSITAPYKEAVIKFLNWISPEAREIGAVNTVVVENDRLLGYNTDAAGLIEPLRKLTGTLTNKKAAVIGAGGAARAAVWALQKAGAEVTLFARNVRRAQLFTDLYDVPCKVLHEASFSKFDLVLNATPLGSGDYIDESPATAKQLSGVECIYDLVYNPIETRLLREAQQAGCKTLGGLDMLVSQAKLQFELWTGIKITDTHGLTQICRSVLSA